MAKKYYDGDITLATDWGGDKTTGNLPVVGEKVQKVIKDSINSKVGYLGHVEKLGQNFYVMCRDEEVFNAYLETITEELRFGDLEMDGIDGRRFDAPSNYKMNLTLINPENGYKSTLADSTGNFIKFKAETLDNNNSPQDESVSVTYKIRTEGGAESSYTLIYEPNVATKGIEYSLDGKLSSGQNIITITVTGMNTGISAMKRITYRLVDMYFADKFDITKRYQFTADGRLSMNIGYSLKGVGKTSIVWYFDGNLHATDSNFNENPDIQNTSKTFYFTKSAHTWLTPGKHTLQMAMICRDADSGEEFHTPIYYREFVVEDTPTVLTNPVIVRKTNFDYSKGFLAVGKNPTIYDSKKYENVTIQYAVYYNGKSSCKVDTFIAYDALHLNEISSENLPLATDDFSALQNQIIDLEEEGIAIITLRAYYNDNEYTEVSTNIEIGPSEMKIVIPEDNLVLFLNAANRSNYSENKDKWEYSYVDEYNNQQLITTDFSKNEYVLISDIDENGFVIPPSDLTDNNCLDVEDLPTEMVENYKYLRCLGQYYIWSREFDWSNTSGWHDGKLKLANGNSITINYQPFSRDKLTTLKEQGATFEFEFETTNVYDDNAVICRICGNKQYAPGISIYASGAELVISRAVQIEGENAGYTKSVSTKYKAEEGNRISFVITPDMDKNSDGTEYRDRILKIYVNGELCGSYAYDNNTNFSNDSKITFRGSEDACVNISSIRFYKRALSSDEILSNYIYFRSNTTDKVNAYKRNDIVLETNKEAFDSDKLKSQLPVMTFYQIKESDSLDDIHQEKKNKKLTRFFDVVYIDLQNPSKNFLIKNAYVTPQGTSSMNYPVKNLRLYSGKKDDAGNYYSRIFVGENIFIDNNPNNLSWDNINLETEVKDKKRRYSFCAPGKYGQDNAIPVNCWCLKADFAESSSSHNTGTARYWNEVLKNSGLMTKAQTKAAQHQDIYPYDVRTCVNGFPIVVFYQSLEGKEPRFEGKYNFNNDKSTEDVFGFTGGEKLNDQEVSYYYIGKERPVIQYDSDKGEYACSFEEGGYTPTPTTDSPLYVSDDEGNWYMLRGKELFDNPKMECWELLNSVNEIALFKTVEGFGLGEDDEQVGIVNGDNFDGAFESRYPDCGDYYHTNSLRRFAEWLVSCRYLNIDDETGLSVPFSVTALPKENYHLNSDGKLSICSLTKKTGTFKFNFPGKNFYEPIDYDLIASNIKNEGYQQVSLSDSVVADLEYVVVDELPTEKLTTTEYIKCEDSFYTWMPSNLLVTDTLPNVHEASYDYVLVGETYYIWNNIYSFSDYHETQWVDDTAFNRALKFAIEKWDHIEMDKMAAYYIYLMRFGGVDQTVKNSMLTTEGPATDDPTSTLPSLWYFINYDNDTILGVKNDGRLVFDPYITRQTKDGTGYVYAGRESTLWNNLEEDAEFMNHVTKIDNQLAEGGANPLYSLSYSNTLREYEINQSDKWCERIYNKDAERKYIDTYVKGWTQKIDKEGSSTHVYEDYLYDVQGSRSAHRKWWLGRRFNVFDSRFCNTNFRNSLIKFRSTNLPAGSVFKIKSGEPIFYAWGHDNAVTEMTPTAIQPGDTYDFVTSSAFNIGSYLELMGAANIATFDLRGCVGALNEIDVTGCYSELIGTKMKEIYIGDHTRNDLVNVSNVSMKFSGLGNASKLEILDVTNIGNIVSLDGLSNLLNIRELYTRGTSIANVTLADGVMIERLELPTVIENLSLTRAANLTYDNIIFEDGKYGSLTNLTIDSCPHLMKDHDFVLNWIGSKTPAQRANLTVNLQGIDWKFNGDNYTSLFLLEGLGANALTKSNIRGNIEITERLNAEDVIRLKKIFSEDVSTAEDCFKEGSSVYIKAPIGLYLNFPTTLWEGENDVRGEILTVGTTLNGTLQVSAMANEIEDGEVVYKTIHNTDGIITMNSDDINKGYVTISIQESNRIFESLVFTALYRDGAIERQQQQTLMINKRIYPDSIKVTSPKDSYNNKFVKNPLNLEFTPEILNDVNYVGRGFFSVKWEMITGSAGYKNALILHDIDKETAYIETTEGFDGTVMIKATLTRNYDGLVLCSAQKQLEFTNPDTIITRAINEPVYKVLVKAGIIKETESEDGTKFGRLTKSEAGRLSIANLIDSSTKKSIFAGNTEITDFTEFQYFSGTYMGQMPQEGVVATVTPDGLFSGCTNLRTIAFSDNFKYTAKNMFKNCNKLEHIYGQENSVDENGQPVYSNLNFEYLGEGFAAGCTSLKTCRLSNSTKYIGKSAFSGCTSMASFRIPTSQNLEIVYTTGDTPFKNCKNITFTGAEYSDGSTAKYQVKDGAVYEVRNDGTLALIHMGKDSLIENLVTDKTVYACAYSMEYRKEDNIVMPHNFILSGDSIFYASVGNYIELVRPFSSMLANGVFSNTNFKTYKFADGETMIPQNCFYQVSNENFVDYVIPEGVVTIGYQSFNECASLKTITFPKSFERVVSNAFWRCESLHTMIFTGSAIPIFANNDFFGVQLENLYVIPENYHAFKEALREYPTLYVLEAFVKPLNSYNEGYVRIIKDGNYIISNENNVIKVGSVDVTPINDYMKYICDDVNDTTVTLNGEVIGNILDRYTTIYLGDNASLYSGDGIDFKHGIYDATIKAAADAKGWFYDANVQGLRSKKNVATSTSTTLKLTLENYIGKTPIPVVYGMYSHNNQVFTISNNAGTALHTINGVNGGYNLYYDADVLDGTLSFKYTRANIIRTGLDGVVINKIGNVVYSDPIVNDNTSIIEVSLNAATNIPNSVVVTVTDGLAHTYQKYWEGSPLQFVVPQGCEFTVSATDFANEEGKLYNLVNEATNITSGNVSLAYEVRTGIEVKNNVLCYYTEYNDYFIYLNKQSGTWGAMDNLIEDINVDDIYVSDANGLVNTRYILTAEPNNIMFTNASKATYFDRGIWGYIPSFIEIEVLKNDIDIINNYLISMGYNTIDLSNCWTSETYDADNAWTSDGEVIAKNVTCNYYIFGKRINY